MCFEYIDSSVHDATRSLLLGMRKLEKSEIRGDETMVDLFLALLTVMVSTGCRCWRNVVAQGHAISTTHPDPGTIVNRKPCNFAIAAIPCAGSTLRQT
jgi:hypothetical protein